MRARTETPKGRPSREAGALCVNAWWEGDDVVALMRTQDGGVREIRSKAQYCHHLRASDVDATLERQLRSSRHITAMKREGDWWRVSYGNWKILRATTQPKGYFDSLKIPTFEADLNPAKRWLVESGVGIARPKRCYLDLELDTRATIDEMLKGRARILTWALVDHETGEAVSGVLPSDDDDAEVELLKDLWYELVAYEQVAAWNGEEFDFPVLWERSNRLGLKARKKRWLWIDQMLIFKRMNMMASESGDEKQSVSLGNVAKQLLGEGKSPVDASKTFEAWSESEASRRALANYNVRDAQLQRMIEEKTGYLELNQTICEACGVVPNTHGADPTQFVESYMMRLARETGTHFRTHYGFEDASAFKGAYVMEPTKLGIIENAHVCDFASLYPSIILSWNISPETYRRDVRLVEDAESRPAYLRHLPLREFPRPEGVAEAPMTRACFDVEKPGILPTAITRLLELRAEWSSAKAAAAPGTTAWVDADRKSSAYKIAANSFYGVMGSMFSRFYERAVAESVSTTGEWLIKAVIRASEARGYDGFYGDTDSVFVAGVTRREFAGFVDWCNTDLFPELLRGQGCRVNRIKLAYEKEFSVLLMVSKKRYAGRYAHYKGTEATEDSKPEIKGLEYKRGDTARLARQLQRELIESILYQGVRDVPTLEQHVQGWRRRILEEELSFEDIVITKQLSKPIEEYKRRELKSGEKSALPAHVEVARQLNLRGHQIRPGARIGYVVVDGSVSPQRVVAAEEFDGEFDRFYLWESLVYPASQRVLEAAFPGSRWRELLKARPRKTRAAAPIEPTSSPSRRNRKLPPVGQESIFLDLN